MAKKSCGLADVNCWFSVNSKTQLPALKSVVMKGVGLQTGGGGALATRYRLSSLPWRSAPQHPPSPFLGINADFPFQLQFSLEPEPIAINCTAFNHNGNLLVTGAADGIVRLFGMLKLGSEVTPQCPQLAASSTVLLPAGKQLWDMPEHQGGSYFLNNSSQE